MNTPDRLPLKSPTNLLKRDVRDLKADVGKLFSALGKTGVSVGFQNWGQVGKDVIEALTALGLKQDQEVLAWLWIRQAMQKCSSSLCDHNRNILPANLNFKDFEDRLNQALAEDALFIDNEFCQHFEQHSLTKILQSCFTDWLATNQVNAESVTKISKDFNDYFIFNLYQEAKINSTTYQPIEWWTEKLNEKAGETEKAWSKYGSWLQEQVDERLFGVEDFSLRQIYIALRAYVVREKKEKEYERVVMDLNQPKNQEKEYERVVIDLPSAIRAWLQQDDKRDGLRIICGGPGCGKSSFTKMLAAELAERGDRVLLIPLHEIDPTQSLENALDQYIKKFRITPPNPLKSENSQNHLLLIFDGLDELAMQGKLATEVAQQFVDKVKDELRGWNHTDLRIRVLMSGRELVVQHLREAKDSSQILHLLPYWLSEDDLKKDSYVDKQTLIKRDQRQDWWRRYGELKGKNYSGLPEEIAQIETIQEITAQPLLNYLVALSYGAGELDFSEKITLNQIYKDLLHRVYKREWAEIQHPTLKNAQITEEQFMQAMAEIAVACWHGNGRTTTVAEIEKHCQHSGISSVLEVFKTSGSQGVTQLLTAFYFRQQGVQGQEKTFEFTHKSFREYLTVRRMITEIEAIEDELDRHSSNGRGWSKQECLRRWAVLCGAEAMDHYLFDWLWGEMQLQPVKQVKKWQKLFCDLISYMLDQGMPMEQFGGLTFLQMSEQSRNAEEALLAVLNACARVTQKVSKIAWGKPEKFGEWLSKLQGKRTDEDESLLISACLAYLDLANCTLIFTDLYEANLQGVNLQQANLQGGNLQRANLQGANLQGANLQGANLQRANLQSVNLQRANLQGVNLQQANLEWAYLEEANLQQANLEWANLEGANLVGANLVGAYLEGTNLYRVYLEGVNIRKADVKGVNIKNIDLSEVIWVDDYGHPLNENP